MKKSYSPGDGAMGDNHPMSWYHDFDGGRSFYTELGHTDESWSDPLYLQHLLGGIEYAMGKKWNRKTSPYRTCASNLCRRFAALRPEVRQANL